MDQLLQYLIIHEVFGAGNDDKGTREESDDLDIDTPDDPEGEG